MIRAFKQPWSRSSYIMEDSTVSASPIYTIYREPHLTDLSLVLVNNAGYATPISADNTNYRAVWMRTLNTNVISVGLITTFFLPLLHLSADPRVINISSARGSFALVTSGSNPPTMNQAYSVSKTALNMLHVAMSKSYPSVLFQLVSPGFTKTAFNRFTGTKDPLDSARSVVELVCAAKEKYCAGFWQWEGKGMEEVDW